MYGPTSHRVNMRVALWKHNVNFVTTETRGLTIEIVGKEGRNYFFGDERDPASGQGHVGHFLYEPGDLAIGVWPVDGEETWGASRKVELSDGSVMYDRDLRGTPWTLDDLNWGPIGGRPHRWDFEDRHREEQAVFRHQVKDGWTMLSCWDRSGDVRYGSVATFVIEGELIPSEAVRRVQEAFPRLWERITAEGYRVPLDPQRVRIEAPRLRVDVPAVVVAVPDVEEDESAEEEEAAEQDARKVPRMRIATEGR